MESVSDEELVERYRTEAGSPRGDSFINQLFQRHHTRVAAWCLRMTGDSNSAADLAQDVFIKAFQRLDSFRGDSKFTTWLYSIARNHCLDEIRTRAARPEVTTAAVLEEMEDVRLEDVFATLAQRDLKAFVQQIMRDSLEQVEAEAMTLHYVHEIPLDTVTRMLRLTNPSGAKAHIVSARRKLSRAVEQWKHRGQKVRGDVRGHAW
jgi:RNA polymerase sigma-70 factor, ECF subfamily